MIQELLIEFSKEDCVKIVNVKKSSAIDQLFIIKLAYLFQKTNFAKIKII